MQTGFDEKAVVKDQGENYVSYLLTDEKIFSTIGYKLIWSGNYKGILKCTKVIFNGKLKLVYMTEKYRRLGRILLSMSEADFLSVSVNLISTVLDMKENTLFKCSNIDLSKDTVFVDYTTLEVYIIYMPFSEGRGLIDEAEAETILRSRIIEWSRLCGAASGERLRKFTDKLQDNNYSLRQIYEMFKITGGQTDKEEEKAAEADKRQNIQEYFMILRYTGIDKTLEFTVNQAEYVLGRSPYRADGQISDNLRIGNVHCKIAKKDCDYYAIDMQSRNGTFLNGIQLRPGDPCLLKKGDVLKLADYAFLVDIVKGR